MAEETKTGVNRNVILFFLFLLSYALLFAMGMAQSAIGAIVANIPVINLFFPITSFVSPMYYLLPIVGFFFTYFIIDWANNYFETKFVLSPFFLLLMIVLYLLALYIALFWMAAEVARLSGRQFPEVNFWPELRNSAFYLFMLSSILAWVSRKVVEKL